MTPKRIAIEVDRHELAAILRFHSDDLAKLGVDLAVSPLSADDDDLDHAARVSARIHELVALVKEF
jgi:hypothetical protein